MDEFIDPKATITPFIAGLTVTFIANTVWYAFGFSPIITALILSILVGLTIVRRYNVSLLYKFVYFLLNSLIIFSLAYSNTLIAKNMTNKHELVYYDNPTGFEREKREYFVDWFNI